MPVPSKPLLAYVYNNYVVSALPMLAQSEEDFFDKFWYRFTNKIKKFILISFPKFTAKASRTTESTKLSSRRRRKNERRKLGLNEKKDRAHWNLTRKNQRNKGEKQGNNIH